MFVKKFFEAYPGLKRWHNIAYRDGQRLGYARTPLGRIRYLDSDKAFSEYFNVPVQGCGADALKKSLRNVLLRLRKALGDKATIVHHVHDEIIVEADDDPEVVRIAKHELEAGMKESLESMLKRVPVKVEAKSGKTWADVH